MVSTSLNRDSVDSLLLDEVSSLDSLLLGEVFSPDSLLVGVSSLIVVPSSLVGSVVKSGILVVSGGIGPLALLVLLLMLISVAHSTSGATVAAGGLEVSFSSETNSLATVDVSGRFVFMSVKVSGVGLKSGLLDPIGGSAFVMSQVHVQS